MRRSEKSFPFAGINDSKEHMNDVCWVYSCLLPGDFWENPWQPPGPWLRVTMSYRKQKVRSCKNKRWLCVWWWCSGLYFETDLTRKLPAWCGVLGCKHTKQRQCCQVKHKHWVEWPQTSSGCYGSCQSLLVPLLGRSFIPDEWLEGSDNIWLFHFSHQSIYLGFFWFRLILTLCNKTNSQWLWWFSCLWCKTYMARLSHC